MNNKRDNLNFLYFLNELTILTNNNKMDIQVKTVAK